MKKAVGGVLSLHLALLSISPAIAEEESDQQGIWQDLDISLGVEASYEPDYQGSDDYEIAVLPLLEVTYKDWLYIEGPAAGAIWQLPLGFRLQTGIGFEEGREEGDNDALEGLDDIENTAVLDAGLYYDIGDLTLGFALEQDLLGRGKGLVTFLGARYGFEFLDDRLEIAPQVDISFANKEHMETEFGISAGEAVNSRFDAYQPGAGLKSYGFGVEAAFEVTEHWTLLGGSSVEFYGPEATDSPLLDEAGADYGAEIEVAIAYRF